MGPLGVCEWCAECFGCGWFVADAGRHLQLPLGGVTAQCIMEQKYGGLRRGGGGGVGMAGPTYYHAEWWAVA